MASLDVGDATLYYELYEEQDGLDRPTVVLLHGVGGNHASWFNQIAAWRRRFRLLVIDARGFGNSSDPMRLGRDRFVDDLHAVLQASGTGRVVLIGQSMGGGTAISFTCRYPSRVAGLVLADTLFGLELPAAQDARMRELSALNAGRSQVERVLGRTCIDGRPDMALLYTAIASFNRANVRNLTGTQALHPPAELAATGVPILFVLGEEDVLFPPEEVEAASRLIDGADYCELARSGHSAYFETPSSFNDVVGRWMERRGVLD
jgi:pimeloyl-ACP methyl ester carboxylesterase